MKIKMVVLSFIDNSCVSFTFLSNKHNRSKWFKWTRNWNALPAVAGPGNIINTCTAIEDHAPRKQ